MKTSLEHLPKSKQAELEKLVKIIRHAEGRVEMIILFGSFARGDWVKNRYVEGNIIYEYRSDYDILLIVKTSRLEKSFATWNRIEDQIERAKDIKTPVSLIVDNIHFINEQLSQGNYFYSDMKKEGIVLYDSGKLKLAIAKELTPGEKRQMLVRDHDIWFGEKAEEFLLDFKNAFKRKSYKIAVFYLHQATESLLVTFLLLYTGYRPKTHDLKKLKQRVEKIAQGFKKIFPTDSEKERKLFSLLRRAYVDARYKENYSIEKSELEILEKKVEKLKRLVARASQKKIASLNE